MSIIHLLSLYSDNNRHFECFFTNTQTASHGFGSATSRLLNSFVSDYNKVINTLTYIGNNAYLRDKLLLKQMWRRSYLSINDTSVSCRRN
jgi:hypothetical protein